MDGDSLPGGVAVAGEIFFNGAPVDVQALDGFGAGIPAQNPAIGLFAKINPALVILGHAFAIIPPEFFSGERGQLRVGKTIRDAQQIDRILAGNEIDPVNADLLVAFRKQSARFLEEEAGGVEALAVGQIHLPGLYRLQGVVFVIRRVLPRVTRKAPAHKPQPENHRRTFQPRHHAVLVANRGRLTRRTGASNQSSASIRDSPSEFRSWCKRRLCGRCRGHP